MKRCYVLWFQLYACPVRNSEEITSLFRFPFSNWESSFSFPPHPNSSSHPTVRNQTLFSLLFLKCWIKHWNFVVFFKPVQLDSLSLQFCKNISFNLTNTKGLQTNKSYEAEFHLALGKKVINYIKDHLVLFFTWEMTNG